MPLPLSSVRHLFRREEPVKRDHRTVPARHRLAAGIPGQRQALAVPRPGEIRLAAIQLDRGETRLAAPLGGRHLIDRNRVVKALVGRPEGIGTGEPERAAAVGIAREPVHAVLHEREIGLVAGQRCEALRERVRRAHVIRLGKPGLLRHAEADAKKDHPLRRPRRLGRTGEPAKPERFEGRQRKQACGGPEESTTRSGCEHAVSPGVDSALANFFLAGEPDSQENPPLHPSPQRKQGKMTCPP